MSLFSLLAGYKERLSYDHPNARASRSLVEPIHVHHAGSLCVAVQLYTPISPPRKITGSYIEITTPATERRRYVLVWIEAYSGISFQVVSWGYKDVFGLDFLHLAKYYDCAMFVITDERNFARAEMLRLPPVGKMCIWKPPCQWEWIASWAESLKVKPGLINRASKVGLHGLSLL